MVQGRRLSLRPQSLYRVQHPRRPVRRRPDRGRGLRVPLAGRRLRHSRTLRGTEAVERHLVDGTIALCSTETSPDWGKLAPIQFRFMTAKKARDLFSSPDTFCLFRASKSHSGGGCNHDVIGTRRQPDPYVLSFLHLFLQLD